MIRVEELLKEEKITEDKIQIWGGEITENELQRFINNWDLSGMPYIVFETFNEIIIAKTSVYYTKLNPEITKRIRIFGNSGDLDLRRDSLSFKWRYIGKYKPPAGIKAVNFWDEHKDKKFFLEEREALLWGKYKGKHEDKSNKKRDIWHDERVAKATLFYPVEGNPERVKIRYKILSENGCISFVWFTELKGGAGNE